MIVEHSGTDHMIFKHAIADDQIAAADEQLLLLARSLIGHAAVRTASSCIVLDSVGIGELPDARAYGDQGSDTLGNIARRVPLRVPTLRALGLARVVDRRTASRPSRSPLGAFGRMAEASPGKDSVTGHWEMMGIVLDRAVPGVSERLSRASSSPSSSAASAAATLGNKAASGTAIIDELGAEHMRTGTPIVYTSADSVFQIAAHEDVVPIPELYRVVRDRVRAGRRRAGRRPRHRAAVRRRARRVHAHREPPRLRAAAARARRCSIALDGRGASRSSRSARSRICSPAAASRRAIHTASDDDGMDEVERADGRRRPRA